MPDLIFKSGENIQAMGAFLKALQAAISEQERKLQRVESFYSLSKRMFQRKEKYRLRLARLRSLKKDFETLGQRFGKEDAAKILEVFLSWSSNQQLRKNSLERARRHAFGEIHPMYALQLLRKQRRKEGSRAQHGGKRLFARKKADQKAVYRNKVSMELRALRAAQWEDIKSLKARRREKRKVRLALKAREKAQLAAARASLREKNRLDGDLSISFEGLASVGAVKQLAARRLQDIFMHALSKRTLRTAVNRAFSAFKGAVEYQVTKSYLEALKLWQERSGQAADQPVPERADSWLGLSCQEWYRWAWKLMTALTARCLHIAQADAKVFEEPSEGSPLPVLVVISDHGGHDLTDRLGKKTNVLCLHEFRGTYVLISAA